MSIIKLHEKYFKTYLSKDKIDLAIKNLASQIAQDLKKETPIFIGVLNGSFMFVADFVRKYNNNCEVSFVKLASYEGTNSTGKIKHLIGLNENLEGRTVVILEDIIDSGNTLQEIFEIFKDKKLKSLKVATLFFKPEVYRKDLHIDYIGISIPDRFIVGYGLDYNGHGRNLEDIYQLTESPTMKNIVLFGPPGAGKGTQADLLKVKYNLVHISTGDVFRFHIKNKTKLGILAQSFMDYGNLVPDEVTINMLKEEVDKNPQAKGFIFDGFPRTVSQAIELDAYLEDKGETIDAMIALEVSENILVKRLLNRGLTSGRIDDQDEEKIRNRFKQYNSKTIVVKDHFEDQNKYYGVNGVGDIEDINDRICAIFDKL